MSEPYRIGVVGNPNCGKTTLFNALTGAKQRVGNWPGVTVERKIGRYQLEDAAFELVDLPGTYALDVTSEDVSLDEKIARDYVHSGEADLILNIVDASNLERNLYLTSQLLEMRRPMLVALNMMDAAEAAGLRIDVERLAEQLGCPVVPVVAVKREGIKALKQALAKAVVEKPLSGAELRYDGALEQAITALRPKLESAAQAAGADPRWLASRLLEADDLALAIGADCVNAAELDALREALPDDVDILLADGRYGFAHRVSSAAVKRKAQVSRSLSDRIDRVMLNRALGIPIFLAAMYLMFMFTINIGGAFIDFFDGLAGTLFVDGVAEGLAAIGAPEWLIVVLANGVGGGIQVVATFIPVIAALYLFLSMLEDSGYMARAAFVMDRAMRAVGLPGKSFVPLIVGFGCNVPAIMATRTLEQQRDRIMTIVMAPFMSCGARLPVYALFAAAFFPIGGQNVVFGLYLIGIAIAVLTGLIMKNTLLQGQTTPFVMELPPYHLPTIKGVSLRTWERTNSFVFRAGKIIVPMVLVLNFLNALGTDGSFGNEDSDQSVLSEVGRGIAPAFAPMGLDAENWPATVGIFTGVLAKEAVVGTLDSMYTAMAQADAAAAGEAEAPVEPFDLWSGISASLATIPANLSDAIGSWGDPLGLAVGDLGDPALAAEEQAVSTGIFGAMQSRFDGAAGAFAYLLFILLYFPCTAALAAVYRETNLGWTLFVAGWTTGIAYIAATVFYQAAIFARNPALSASWIGAMLALFVSVILALRWWGMREKRRLFRAMAADAA
ncbi:ferrous iron transport protein B [Lamprobacter modestohalophilus]|uniref:Ferrous iron transport protein B n=1 Tax=Lamprobacter modestohalophilus TaxID=1064514 RepID=A0A9X0W5Z5_9GAMM|nr:Fe(2+) transporter permease subunit FeoB [Lamprobacter modestohalophilus]MBK1617530.1 ferrous iron transport protein B [Lamprobacter modestohalophilus]